MTPLSFRQCFSSSRALQAAWLIVTGFCLVFFTRRPDAPMLYPSLAITISLILALAGLAFSRSRSTPGPNENTMPSTLDFCVCVGGFTGLAILYLSSGMIGDPWFFPNQWIADTDFFNSLSRQGWVRALSLALIFMGAFRFLPGTSRGVALVTISTMGLCFFLLHKATGMEMIYRVDSPAFVYRYWSLLNTFPSPAFYDPHWNAGMPVPFLVASGVWSLGVALLPWLAFFPPEVIYTPALAVIFLIVVPGLAWLSLYWIKASPRACWLAALLALSPTQRYWVHLLHYGTAPALFCLTLTLPLAALTYKYLYLDSKPKPGTMLLLLVCGLFFFTWPGSLIAATPFVLACGVSLSTFFPRKWIWALVLLVTIAAIMWPLAEVPMRYSRIDKFIAVTAHQSWLEHFKNGLGVLAHNLRGTNPVIVILGFIGITLWPESSARRFFIPIILGLLALSGWGEEIKKLLQTERMIIPAAMVAIIPAACWLDKMIAYAQRPGAPIARVSASFFFALAIVSGYAAAKTWGGKGMAPYHTMPENTRAMIAWIKEHVPEDGRVLFAGAAIHGYGGAKVAALPYLTGRAMMACDFYGFSPRLVEYQYPPKAFRYSGPDVLFAFMDIYNVTHVITWHEDWKKVFHRTGQYYRPAQTFGRVELFETRRPSSLFHQGRGTVTATFNRFDLALPGDGEPVVIRYNWSDELSASTGATLFPYDAGRGVTLIGVEPGTNQHVRISFRP